MSDPVAPGAVHKPMSKGGILTIYLVVLALVVVFAVGLNIVMHTNGFFWAMTIFGAIVISTLISSAVVPYLRGKH